MTPEYFSRPREIYEATLIRNTAERAAFLQQECRGDESVRRDVELLLEARQRVPEWLNGPVLVSAPTVESPASLVPSMVGRQLGGYQLVREIGRGGMGSVYLAERSDGAFHRQAAVKLIQPGMNTADVLTRFRQEREILATLDHPAICRLLDAGATEEGLPWFIMEFVDGKPIQRWCDEHKLNVTERLQLFRKVCEAVHYAHQRLVVHCDLKPGNILVTAEGTVKLLDFGIAKILNPKKPGHQETTRTQLRAMTPEYASPEQMTGAVVTTLTDVYSLGAILYELLTGHRPHHLIRAAMHEMARVIAEEEPKRPSRVVAVTEERLTPQVVSEVREGQPDRLRKRLEGDLDCILLTALHKEPQRRYSSAEALGEDLERHLEHRPVKAREDSLWYRTTRFVRRHPGGVASGVLIVLSAIAGVLTTLWESRIVIEAMGHRMSGRAILAPQMALFGYIALAGFGVAAFLTRAVFLRATGAFAGGIVYAMGWLLKLKIGSTIGWWQSRFSETPMEMFSQLAFPFTLIFAGAAILLIAWRVARRFGWPGQIVLIVAVAVGQAIRERVWFDTFMQVMTATAGVLPVLGDAALLAAGLMSGYAAMRLIAGPAPKDRLARVPQGVM